MTRGNQFHLASMQRKLFIAVALSGAKRTTMLQPSFPAFERTCCSRHTTPWIALAWHPPCLVVPGRLTLMGQEHGRTIQLAEVALETEVDILHNKQLNQFLY